MLSPALVPTQWSPFSWAASKLTLYKLVIALAGAEDAFLKTADRMRGLRRAGTGCAFGGWEGTPKGGKKAEVGTEERAFHPKGSSRTTHSDPIVRHRSRAEREARHREGDPQVSKPSWCAGVECRLCPALGLVCVGGNAPSPLRLK